ncbi:MAG: HEAT repeat domain-containing protein [candidate division Zixibacteria bacterium]|nr:HEAT repeat domain-containing protein [candidate division Zixibacteria bacterium]
MYALKDILYSKRKFNLTKSALKICLVLLWPVMYGLYFVTTQDPNFHILTLFKASVAGLAFMAFISLYFFLRYGIKYLSFKNATLKDRSYIYYTYCIVSGYLAEAGKFKDDVFTREAEEIRDMMLRAFKDFEYDLETDLKHLKSNDELEKQVAVFSLSVHAYNNISRLVRVMKEEKDKDLKTTLMAIIGVSGSRVGVKPLIDELRNPDEEIREAAVAMLSSSRFTEAAAAVEKYDNERRPESS